MGASSPAIARRPSGAAAPTPFARRERTFFSGMALALALAVFLGFAPSYYMKSYFGAPPELDSLLHWHGVVFSMWMVLLVGQTSLVAAGRTDLHRRMGVAGVVLALVMILLGASVAITRAQQGLLGGGAAPPLQFLAIPIAGLVVFPALLGAAIWFRRRSDIHKRLMLIATIEVATAGMARLPVIADLGPPAFFGMANLFVLAIVTYDLVTLKRVHTATIFGGAFLVASQVLRLVISETGWWQSLAVWLTS